MERDARNRNAPAAGAASAEPTPGKRTLTSGIAPAVQRNNELDPIRPRPAPAVAPRAKPDETTDQEQEQEAEEPVMEAAPTPAPAPAATVSTLPRLDLGRPKS